MNNRRSNFKRSKDGKELQNNKVTSNGERFYPVDSLSALIEFAKFRPKAIKAIYCKKALHRKVLDKLPSFADLIAVCESEEKAGFGGERSVWADVLVKPLTESEFSAKRSLRKKDIVLVLDHITDPRNLGAIVRSAAFFGVTEVVVAKNRQVTLTDASVATSQGGFALTDLVLVTNISRSVEQLKKDGYWVIGCDMGGEKVEALAGEYDKIALVLGSEDKGLSALVQKKCDRFVGIDGPERSLESLNVSVAAGILLRGMYFGQNMKISDV